MARISLTLMAADTEQLSAIASCLKRNDLPIAVLNVAALASGAESPDPGPVFLFLPDKNLIPNGELTKRVRDSLGSERRLVLCMPLTTHRKQLLEMGADDIIIPASPSPTDVAERILGEVISSGHIQPTSCGQLRGATEPMRKLYREIETVASFEREPMLILGETGSGKELVARELHNQSSRANGPLIAVNVGELQSELFGSDLFGHRKGAFTTAISERKGLIQTAEGGTLFLDEIGTLETSLQIKLLRVLEDRAVRKLGDNESVKVDVHFVFATNKNLEEECEVGRFQRDLFARIRAITLNVPPLRERRADIPLLCDHFLQEFNREYGRECIIPPNAIDCLFKYDWPENVRELRNALRKAAVFADEGGCISANVLIESTQGRQSRAVRNTVEFDPWMHRWHDLVEMAEEVYFKAVLIAAQGNREVAIKMSGLSKAQFYHKLKDIGLKP